MAAANATANGVGARALGQNSYAGGFDAVAAGANSMAVGARAQAFGDNSMALGANAQVTSGASNAVAIGANSIASESNTVSFGAPGAERRLTNIAPGVNFSDAATFGQLQIGLNVIGKRINTANSGVAMSMAMSAVPLSLRQGEQGVSGGVAVFEGRSALGLRYQGQPTENVTIGVSLGFAEGAKTAASAGVGVKW
jgi:trimeric autotransporter adhesin